MKNRELRYAANGQTYLSDGSLLPLKKYPKRKALVASICQEPDTVFLATVEMEDGTYLVNVKTGSTFDPRTLRCRSGNLRIKEFLP
jgi:hypothetical protein